NAHRIDYELGGRRTSAPTMRWSTTRLRYSTPVTRDDSALRQLIVPEGEDVRVVVECIRIARQIRHSQKKIVGLAPAAADVAVPPLALQLGAALVGLTEGTVALVDANLRWPFAAAEANDSRTLGGTAFTGRWLKSSLALLAPHRTKGSAPSLMELELLLQ